VEVHTAIFLEKSRGIFMKIKDPKNSTTLYLAVTVCFLFTLGAALTILGGYILLQGTAGIHSLPSYIFTAIAFSLTRPLSFVIVVTATCLGLAALSIWASGYVSKSISPLVREVYKLKEANFEHHVHVDSSDERIVFLAGAFNDMADRLNDCMQNVVSLSHIQTELEQAANTDQLTGVNNRRYFMESAVKRLEAVSKTGVRMYAVLFDLDHFKKINDTYGHPAGDKVLKDIAKAVKQSVRSIDLFARYGGEEFVLLLGSMPKSTVSELLDRIRAKICAAPIEFEDLKIPVSASFGFASVSPRNDLSEAIANADLALYKAKHEGRNRVICYEREESEILISPAEINDIGIVREFQKNQTVFTQSDAGTEMYVVQKGVFGVYINSFTGFPIRVKGIQQGSFFGEMSVIDGSLRSATVIAEEESLALYINKESFEKLLAKSPETATGIYNTLKIRVDYAAEAARDTGKKVPEMPKHEKNEYDMLAMAELAKYLRQMNELLSAPSDAMDTPDTEEAEEAEVKGSITLLPTGFIPFGSDQYDEYDNNRFLQQKQLVCPYCVNTFDSVIPLFSNLVRVDSELDGRVVYHKFDILRYTNIICPNCNYTDTYQEFNMQPPQNGKIKHSGNMFANVEGFTGYANTNVHTLNEAVMSYYQNIECLRRVANTPLRLAKAWHRLYWIYNDNKREEYAAYAAGKAYYFYAKYAKKHNLENRVCMNAILGELSVATGNYLQATKHFQENTGIVEWESNDIVKRCERRLREIKNM
jgi:diguanylate cyclase (GGDEF)-like protein